MEPTATAQSGGQTVAQAAAAAVSPDPVTATLLVKHGAGERLTASEYGKLGAFASKVKKLFSGKGSAAAHTTDQESEAQDGSSIDPPPDADLVKRTTGAVLHSVNSGIQKFVQREARKAQADDRTTNRCVVAASLPEPTKELVVETSPELLESIGVNPRHYPLAIFVGAMGLWATNIYLVVDELRALRKPEPAPAPAPAQSQPGASQSKTPAASQPTNPS